MSDVVYLIMRRMRVPLLALIVVLAGCTIGFSLVPGIDADGNPAPPISLFHAFYVISYTATTIGFGEIPGEYSDPQRMWMVASIYLTVSCWYYAMVTVLSLVQDRSFQLAVRTGRFTARVGGLREPFYIVCGAGETGWLICRGLDRLGRRFVVIELDAARLQEVGLDDYHADVPMLDADAAQPAVLQRAGLLSPFCRGVVAVVNDDTANQAIAVTVRLLAPKVPVLARIRDVEAETHIGVFGGDLVINPFDRFAEHLSAAVSAPQRYRLREVLTGLEGDPLPAAFHPPLGHWIMCGWGRFGHAVTEELRAAGNTVTVIDQHNYEPGVVDVRGTGTDSDSLEAAGITHAVGLVAGNASDTKNLAIGVTARDINPDIFLVTRQNQNANSPLYDAFHSDLDMVPSRIVAREFLARITTPLLVRFLNRLPFHSEEQCALLCEALGQANNGHNPVIWSCKIDATQAEGLVGHLADGGTLTFGQLRQGVAPNEGPLRFIVLLVDRAHRVMEQPDDSFQLRLGDEILFASSNYARRWVAMRLRNFNALSLVADPKQRGGGGTLWRWAAGRRRRRRAAAAASLAGSPEQVRAG